uniref:Uncharacterized protein n=1 Tax=Romanomermis culicivorax TaxID=13658 RepID=A0A915JJK0_ROMCU
MPDLKLDVAELWRQYLKLMAMIRTHLTHIESKTLLKAYQLLGVQCIDRYHQTC